MKLIFNNPYHKFLTLTMAAIYQLLLINLPAQSEQQLSVEEQSKTLQLITANLNTVQNLQADFRQERHLSILIEPLISRGKCYFEKPLKLRWEISEPYQSILIYKDDQVSKFDAVNGKLRKLELGSEDLMRGILKQIISWMQGDFSQTQNIYHLQIYKSAYFRLELKPKSKELQKNIQSIDLVFNKNLKHIETVTIQESPDDFIKIIFSNEQNNTDIEPAIFDLRNPKLMNPLPNNIEK